MRILNNITRGINRLGINAGKPAGLPGALRNKFLFLWTGGYTGDNLKDALGSAAVITVTNKDWTTRYIDPDTAATFAVPDNATFLGADGDDDFWFSALDALQQKTLADLIASTTLRTFVKYADFEPYFVYGIGILKAGETLTDADKIKLNRYFKLWAEYWGVLMDSGYMKDNRIVDESWSSYWLTRIITGLTVTVDSATQFTLNWTNGGVTDYTGHKAYISTDGVTFSLNKTVASIQTSMVLTGLTPDTIYYVKIAPYKATNIGTLSDAAVSSTLSTADLLVMYDGTVAGTELTDKSGNNYHGVYTTNAAANSGMEEDYWWYAVTGEMEFSSTQAHGGTRSLKFTGDLNETINSGNFETITGRTYTYSFWVFRESGTGSIGIQIYEGDGTGFNVNLTKKLTTGVWVECTGSWTEDVGGKLASVRLYSDFATKVMYIDDIVITSDNANDRYIQFPNQAALIAVDTALTFYDASGFPKSILSQNLASYKNDFFYNLNYNKALMYSSDQLGRKFLAAHDFINWNPITSITENVVSVKKDGTGDYLTIKAAIAGIVDASATKKYRIDIYDDWTVTDKAEYDTLVGSYHWWLNFKDYLYFNGVGSSKIKLTLSIPADSSDEETTYYEIGNTNNCITGFNNLEISIKNGRYAHHCDAPDIEYSYNCTFINYGNQEVVDYRVANAIPAGTPFNGATIGCGTDDAVRLWMYNCEIIGKFPVQVHDNKDFTSKSIVGFIKCALTSNTTEESLYVNCIGNTAIVNEVQAHVCTLNKAIELTGRVNDADVYYLLRSQTIIGGDTTYDGYSNTYTAGGSLRITSATAGAVVITGGTAEAVIMPDADEVDNHATGRMEVGEWIDAPLIKLGVRLGDCSGVPKDLTMTIDGGAVTVTFNENFTAQTNAQVLAFINTALGANGTASLYQRAKDFVPSIS